MKQALENVQDGAKKNYQGLKSTGRKDIALTYSSQKDLQHNGKILVATMCSSR